MTDQPRRSLFERAILAPRAARLAPQTRPADARAQPRDVRRRDRRRPHLADLDPRRRRRERVRRRRRPGVVRRHGRGVAVADRALRQLRRGDRRRSREGPGRDAPRHAHRHDRPDAGRHRAPGRRAAPRRPRRGRGGRADPRRWHRGRGHRLGRRVRDHRRVRPGDPGGRWGPQRGDGRHPRPLRPRRRRDHPGARPELPRPDDRARRGRRPPEDAERDRPRHPAGRADDRLPARRRGAAPVRGAGRHARLRSRR